MTNADIVPDGGLEVLLAPRRSTRHGSRQFYAHLFMVLLVLVVALVGGQPMLVLLVGPSLGLLCWALLRQHPPVVELEAGFDRRSGVEGDLTTLAIRATSTGPGALVDIAVEYPEALRPRGPTRHLARIARGGHHDFIAPVEMSVWGISSPRLVVLRTSDALGLISRRQDFGCRCRLRTHLPDPDTRSLLDPSTFLRIVGNHTSRGVGDGCELADARPYRPGDRLRDINWRITARFDEPWITERHPDRATTMVIVVDADRDAGIDRDRALRRSARFAMALAQSHLRVNDQVGLAITGRKHRWIQPRAGRLQLERITEALLEINSDAERGETIRLTSVVPNDAIVVVVSAMPSEDLIDHTRALMARGSLVHLVEPEIATVAVTELPTITPSPLRKALHIGGFVRDDERSQATAARIFAIEAERRRRRLHGSGLSILSWRLDEPVEAVLLALRTAQRARSIDQTPPAASPADLVAGAP